jgi:putative two-component system response regulator
VKPLWPGQLLITVVNALRRRELELAFKARSRNQLLGLDRKRCSYVTSSQPPSSRRSTSCACLVRRRSSGSRRRSSFMTPRPGSTSTGWRRSPLYWGTTWASAPDRVDLLCLAAPMHDVGKIGTSDQILRKPGPLTSKEGKEMERHTVIGHEILADSESELLNIAATIALTHHERYDGSGYPQGLAGEEIPLEGRIVAVADAFDALLSDRCYRPALPPAETIAVIEEERGTHFDPQIADVLLDHREQALSLRG